MAVDIESGGIKHKQAFLVLAFLFFALTASSQIINITPQTDTVNVEDLIKLSFEELIDMPVYSATKIPVKVSEAPSIVSIVGRDEKEKFQWLSLNDILSKQAGFTLGQDRFNHVINSRGISDLFWNKRLLVLFDGVPFSSFQSTVTDRAFSLNMASSVEVVRGPGSVLYGTQAVTGVIQVNSLSSDELVGNGVAVVQAGNYGYRNIDILTKVPGEQFNTLISFNHFATEGNEVESYGALLQRGPDGNFIRQKTQDNRNSVHFWAKVEGIDKLEGFSIRYHFQNYQFQMGHGFLTFFPEIEKTSNVNRNFLIAKYIKPFSEGRIIHEYVLKYDYEVSDFDLQIAPIGFVRRLPTGELDSSGVYERYITPVHGAFARTQWTYFFEKKASLLGGLEQNTNLYLGDKAHYSNINLNEPGFIPFGGGRIEDVGPLYEPIQNRPVNISSIYAQFTTGNLLGNKLTATLGGRCDVYYYKFKDLLTGRDSVRVLSHPSPRIALVYSVNEDISIKALYGNAFRLASPFEQFLANSLVTGTTTEKLDPEIIDTYELSSEWMVFRNVRWRNTLFYSIFKGQIISILRFNNILDSRHAGAESELDISAGSFSGFVNYSFVKRIEEISNDTLFTAENSLIWYPAHSANIGISYNLRRITITAQGHYQDIVDRRDSEKGVATSGVNQGINMDELRGRQVDSWYTIDFNLKYAINNKIELRLIVNNVLDKKYYLINNLGGRTPQPFDYQQQGRRIIVAMKFLL